MRKRRRYIGGFLSLLTVSLLLGNMTVFAGNGKPQIKKRHTFVTTNAKETCDQEFDQMIREDGKKYELQSIAYAVKEKQAKKEKQPVEKVIESPIVSPGSDYEPEKTMTQDGRIYQFDRKEPLTENTKQQVTGYYDYDHPVTEGDVPGKRDITVTNDATGEAVSVACQLAGVEQLAVGDWIDTHINITFVSYDSEIFEWQGIVVEKSNANPLAGYESQLLASVGADTENYRVTGTAWSSEPYDNNGTICRDAVASVERYVRYYRANYAGTLDQGMRYRLIYKGTQEVESKTDFHYKIEATATYERYKIPMTYYIMAGAGILILAGLIAGILFLLAKRRKEKEKETT